MRRPPESFTATVRAFKELTAATGDAEATRARVLAAVHRGSRAGSTPRRISLPIVAGLLVIGTASVAGTTLGYHWRQPAAVTIVEIQAPHVPAHAERHASVVIPPVGPAAVAAAPVGVTGAGTSASGATEAEAAAYGRAHHLHFSADRPAAALAAWDDYLRGYPRGAFAPEAHYNRALCLVRLARFDEAGRALQPFTDGRFGDYRHAEADRLLDWLRDRLPAR
jgi:hypothetical protein